MLHPLSVYGVFLPKFRRIKENRFYVLAQKLLKAQTAKQARKDLATEAQKTYTVKTGRFNKAMKIKNATPSRLEATIKATGKVMGLKDFKVSPATMRTGENRPEVVKAKVLKSGGMKPLQMGSLKAFVTKFASGHVAVAQRRGLVVVRFVYAKKQGYVGILSAVLVFYFPVGNPDD